MTLRDFINKLLGRQPASATTARERLQLVLAHDRSDLNPELLEQMRREIFEVVSRYVEIDLEGGDVSLETEDRVTALVANLPIKRARPVVLPPADSGAGEPPEAAKAAADPAPEDQPAEAAPEAAAAETASV
ncbi:MAG: cell division topological specificity factor MinE [Cyanobacteriota bacterium]|jgi:cell division topological specificity factor